MSYEEILQQLQALTQGVPHRIANLANASALLALALPELNWVGFYLLEGETLVLGPFQGKPACIEIPLGRGVCGKAAREDTILLVPDVHQFPGHIACDCASNAELVVPLHKEGRVAALLDLDSPRKGRFTEVDREGMALLQGALEALL